MVTTASSKFAGPKGLAGSSPATRIPLFIRKAGVVVIRRAFSALRCSRPERPLRSGARKRPPGGLRPLTHHAGFPNEQVLVKTSLLGAGLRQLRSIFPAFLFSYPLHHCFCGGWGVRFVSADEVDEAVGGAGFLGGGDQGEVGDWFAGGPGLCARGPCV